VSLVIERDAAVRASYGRDASGLTRVPEGVLRVREPAEVLALLAESQANRSPVTPAGGQTSTTGASITDRGTLLSLRAMDRVLDVDAKARVARVEPGVLLGDLDRAIASEGLFFAPDPTSDQECTIGGAIACNASGPRTLRYGATRAHVRGLTVALIEGTVLELRRPALEKNTVGYHMAQDPIDWFVGSEGTLGVILSAEVALLPRPRVEMGLGIPFPDAASALAFIVAAREATALAPRCLEYFDAEAFRIARVGEASWGSDGDAMVYVEHAGDDDMPLEDWEALATAHGAHVDASHIFDGDAAIRAARRLRHAVPATMHERVAPFLAQGGRRVSTDWAVPYRDAARMIAQADAFAREAGISAAVTYGHLGNGHPHQNFVARNPEEVARCEAVVERTLHSVLAMGGTVAAEHGIGKVKARWLPMQMSPVQRRAMQALKRELDPLGLLAPGNIL
jgi:FAD/FMN-containing dehydrogenase